MQRGNFSRRGFLARALGGLTAAGLPIWYANEILVDAQEKDPNTSSNPNSRIVMGAIGTGTNRIRRGRNPLRGERGVHIMQDAMRQEGVQMIATCDVDTPNGEYSRDLVRNAMAGGSRDARLYSDYRELLQNRDIQAVTIGTPDHWHANIAIAALRAGKDVYCEKPLTLTIDEGKNLARVARETGRILQTGSQQRSDARFRLACELVRNGRIGTVRQITTLIGENPTAGPFEVKPVPEGLNWDFWQGPTAQTDYMDERCFYEFRWWYEYSGGKMTDWGAHHNDIAQWALGMDDSGPVTVTGRGTPRPNDGRHYNCHTQFEVQYTYANGPNAAEGTRLVCRPVPPEGWSIRNNGQLMTNGILFEGDDQKWIFVNRNVILASQPSLLTEPLPMTATRLPVSTNHMGNFIECVRSRQQPICNYQVGYRSVSVCHLGVIGIRFFPGTTLRWDPRAERFTGANADEANRHLSRPQRAPYRMEA